MEKIAIRQAKSSARLRIAILSFIDSEERGTCVFVHKYVDKLVNCE